MHINLLPKLCFYNILEYLSIDERDKIFPIFPNFYDCFQKISTTVKNTKSLGIYNIETVESNSNTLCEFIFSHHDDLMESWACEDSNHVPSHFFSNNLAMKTKCDNCNDYMLLCALKKCVLIESLDLRGLRLTEELLEGIIKYCPNLNCIRLNFVTFDCNSLDIFVRLICPNIKHLSLDNLFLDNFAYRLLFTNLSNLNQLELTVFSTDNLKPVELQFLSSNLIFASINFKKLKNTPVYSISSFIDNLTLGSAKDIEYLKVKSNYTYMENYELTCEIKKFVKLKALNLSIMSFYHPNITYDMKHCWPVLQSLTIDFYDLRCSNDLLLQFLKGKFNITLERLRIMSCVLLRRTVLFMKLYCPNLTDLALVDVTLRSFKNVFKLLLLFHKLKVLRIEYTFNENLERKLASRSEINTFENLLTFPLNKINAVENFFQYHSSIRKVSFLDWPGLTWAHAQQIRKISSQRNINFIFRQYTL